MAETYPMRATVPRDTIHTHADDTGAAVLRFVADFPSSTTLAFLRARGFIHDRGISQLLAPYHYFWHTLSTTESARGGIEGCPEIIEADRDLRSGELCSIERAPRLEPSTDTRRLQPLAAHSCASVIVGIIDSGFDLDHPNLNYVDRPLHFNATEFFERQRRRAGLLERGREHYDASRAILAHGTAVAGAAAAFRRNAGEPAIAGVAPGAPIMPLKVGARPTPAEVAAAINWAVEHGARVINMSFKVRSQPVLSRAIEQAWSQGVLLCAASGNQRSGHPHAGVDFPARHPNVLAVGAIDRRGHRKRLNLAAERDWGSQYGAELDLVAPGTEVQALDDRGELGALPGNYAMNSIGTSIAAPQVAGLAALLFSIDPMLTNQQVRDAIEGGCLKLPGYRFERVPGRVWTWNREVGYGAIQLAASRALVTEQHASRRGATS